MKADFPSLADEIAEPRPDVNIEVAAFTVSEKSNNNYILIFFIHIDTISMGLTILNFKGSKVEVNYDVFLSLKFFLS